MDSLPFINLHTHRKPQTKDEIVVRNAFLKAPDSIDSINYFCSCGIHPWLLNDGFEKDIIQLERLLELKKVIAVGECGLDRLKGPEISFQRTALLKHIELANQCNKPIILHLVKTYSDILEFKSRFKTPWIIHGFKGNETESKNLINAGARLSFGPRLLHDESLQQVFKQTSLENIYLETDTKSFSIQSIYKKAAELKGFEINQLKLVLTANFKRDFLLVLPNE
jgi:TatD DNase family protein